MQKDVVQFTQTFCYILGNRYSWFLNQIIQRKSLNIIQSSYFFVTESLYSMDTLNIFRFVKNHDYICDYLWSFNKLSHLM